MSRIRTIKPDFWTDGVIIDLSILARLLYIGTWNFTICDHGHLPDDASKLKLQILPNDDCDVRALLQELIDAGRIVRVQGPDGRTFLHIKRFLEHQKIDPRWRTRCPACALANSGELTETPLSSPELTETPPNSSQDGKGWEGMGREELPSSPPATIDPASRFPEFWAYYPRKVARGSAVKAFRSAVRRAPAQVIIAAIARYSTDPNLPDMHLIPHASTWLNGDRWGDPPEPNRKQPSKEAVSDGRVNQAYAALESLRKQGVNTGTNHRQIEAS